MFPALTPYRPWCFCVGDRETQMSNPINVFQSQFAQHIVVAHKRLPRVVGLAFFHQIDERSHSRIPQPRDSLCVSVAIWMPRISAGKQQVFNDPVASLEGTSKSLPFGRPIPTHLSSDSFNRFNKNASIISSSSAKPTSITSARSIASIITWKGLISRSKTLCFLPQKLPAPINRKRNQPNPKRFRCRASTVKNGWEAYSSTIHRKRPSFQLLHLLSSSSAQPVTAMALSGEPGN